MNEIDSSDIKFENGNLTLKFNNKGEYILKVKIMTKDERYSFEEIKIKVKDRQS